MTAQPSMTLLPAGAPPVVYGPQDAREAWDLYGANCGPGAIAGLCGTSPLRVAPLLGEKLRRIGGTTEIMLTNALTELGVTWHEVHARPALYGICRIQWDGPWMTDADPYEKLRHSHWVGMANSPGGARLVFDYNAIAQGGWLTLEDWDQHLRPWLLQNHEPEATGDWWISNTYEIPLPQPGVPVTAQ